MQNCVESIWNAECEDAPAALPQDKNSKFWQYP